jgi:riboflavin synthase
MFTGIVEEAGVVHEIRSGRAGIQLSVRTRLAARDLKPGASLAVNGCCLTVVKVSSRQKRQKLLEFDLLRETWERTNLQFARPGALVNLERPLRADGRLDGHFVTGHIDATGEIVELKRAGADYFLEITASPDLLRGIVFKGSMAVDGISLTVARVRQKSFSLWIIPHTWAVTALRERRVGDAVNLETDILGKYVERFLKVAGA